MSPMGEPLPHESAIEHVRGLAAYVDDLPAIQGELFVDVVGSPIAYGRIDSIDTAAAKGVAGIVGVYTAGDIPENIFGPVFHDEELLASQWVQFHSQPIVAIAGESRDAVAAAKKLIQVAISSLSPVLTIDEAIERNQFIGPQRHIATGDAKAAIDSALHRLTGELRIGGQEHFYLEPQAAIAVPGERGEITVHSSTQNPTETQAIVARILRRQMSQVTCDCRRMGGGFGGKETQGALPAAIAAFVADKTRRPARFIYGHEHDFRTTGKRHPYLVRYAVGFNNDGIIQGYRAEFYSNGGFSADLSLAVMERTLLHGENAYYIPNAEFIGRVCRTNLPSNTAFRGFGGPQAVAAIESVIEEIANHLKIDSLEVRRRNCYGQPPRNVTPYGQVVSNNTLPELFDRLIETSAYRVRRAAISEFNAKSPTHLKGIALTPVKFGISFTRRTMNQGNALVHVFTDGTVQVSTGGTEMGQGLNTKIRQLVASEFGLDVDHVRVMPTSTDRNHNTSPTAASASTDINGTAAVRACAQIKERLAAVAHVHFKTSDFRTVPFKELVRAAYEDRIDLGARGFYATPGLEFDRETGKGAPFLYYTNGAAVAEVLVDRFLGDLEVTRVDLLMDLGRMINPAIDRGQVIGGFVQGMGWVTTEYLNFDDAGRLLSDSATTYKIPHVTDVPVDFRVDFIDNSNNHENVAGSKAVGEPPLLLATSVWSAAKNALSYVAPGKVCRLGLPATGEEMLMRLTELLAGRESMPSPSVNGSVVSSPNRARL